MCYLCFKDNPFSVVDDSSSMQYKRMRMKEIKRLLRNAEEDFKTHGGCDNGDEITDRLKEEQYRISRDL